MTFTKLQKDGVDAALAAAASEGARLEAISFYNTILEKTDLKEFAQSLQADLREKKVLFGDRLLCPFLRPNFVGREQLNLLASAVRGVVGAMNVLAPRLVEEPELQDFLGMTEQERMLCAVDPGYSDMSVTSRLDSFLLGGKVRFVEYNAEVPAGIGYNDKMSDAFMATDVMKEFNKFYPSSPLYTCDALLNALIDTYRRWGGKDDPVIGIVDYDNLPTVPEFEILQEFFSSRGYKTVVSDPRKLSIRNDELYAGDQKINLVYRRLLTNEFLEKFDENKSVFDAYKAGTICAVNTFRSKYLHKKAIFALITDPKYQDGMTEEQLFSVYTYVPWTRKVEDNKTTDPEGHPIELLYFIRQNRRDLVMKPNDEYGGKGIFVGWELDDREWDNAIQTALSAHYLVQTRVEVARDSYPSWNQDEKAIQWGEYTVDLDPFVFFGEIEGLLTRLSATALCNVTAGGGGVPTFVLE
jgi:uncharacterized circularly permuted ATP-grasp superfamily protein